MVWLRRRIKATRGMVCHPSFFLRHQIKINRVIDTSGCCLKAGWSRYFAYSKMSIDGNLSILLIILNNPLTHWAKTNTAGNENSVNDGSICNGSIYSGPRYSPVTREDSCWSLVCIITSCLGFIFQWVIRTRFLQPSLLPSKAVCLVRQLCFLPQYPFWLRTWSRQSTLWPSVWLSASVRICCEWA